MKLTAKPVLTLTVVALILATPLLAGCNTTKGMGKDIESAGSGIQNSAEKNGAD